MKMQLVTIRPNKSGIDDGFRIRREIFDDCGLVDMAFCSIRTVKNGFVASGFSSIYKPTIIHEVSKLNESIDDFIKAVFSK
jgi:hypothetical protein|nr:MAG TPA: hypothetical protein [Caudoviricetes sp.]